MARRKGITATLGVALLASGCASWGLNPVPKKVASGRGLRLGLDMTPDRVSREPDAGLGLHPFPEEIETGDNPGTGLSPFPFAGQPEGEAKAGFLKKYPEPEPPPAPVRRRMPVREAPARNDAPESSAAPVRGPAPKAATGPAVAKAAPRLALRFHVNDRARLRVKHEMAQELPVMNGMQDSTTRAEFEVTQNVVEVGEAGKGNVRNTVDAVKFELESPMMTLGFDSRDPDTVKEFEENPIAQQVGLVMLTGISGTTFDVAQNADGTVAEADGVPPAAMNMGLNPEQFMGMGSGLPEGPVAKGLTWNVEKTREGALAGRDLKTSARYEVTEWNPDSGRAVVTMTASLTLSKAAEGEEDPAAMGGATNLAMKEGEVKSTSVFDLGKGIRESVQTTSRIVLTFSHPMLGDGIEQIIRVTSSTERLP